MCQYNRIALYIVSILLIYGMHAEDLKNYAGPYRPYSPELIEVSNELKGMDEAAFAKLSIDDPLLKRAYHDVFNTAVAGNLNMTLPELKAALSDMRRRGDTITPMLLKLMNENQETGLEVCVLVGISNVGTLNTEPYLEYARNILSKRTHTMSASLAGAASVLLSLEGTKEDAMLMDWVMEQRPWLAASVKLGFDELNRRLGLPKRESRLPLKERRSTSESPNGTSGGMEHKTPAVTAANELKAPPWVAWALTILIAGGLIWQVFNQRKFRGQ